MTFVIDSRPSARIAGTAVGPDARNLRRSVRKAQMGRSNSVQVQRFADAFVALLEACGDASEANWDGYGGQPISIESFLAAEDLLQTLPPDIPLPEVDVHPDGQVGLDWVIDRDHMFSLAVDDKGTVAYAGHSGAAKVSGREAFAGTFPSTVYFHLARVLRA